VDRPLPESFNNGAGDVTLTADVMEGIASVTGAAEGEWAFDVNEVQLNIDIGNDGNTDCSAEADIVSPPPPGP